MREKVNIGQARAIGSARQWVGFIETRQDCSFTFDWQMHYSARYLPQYHLDNLLWENPDTAARELVRFILRWVPYYRDKGARDGWKALRREANRRAKPEYWDPDAEEDRYSFTVWPVLQMQS